MSKESSSATADPVPRADSVSSMKASVHLGNSQLESFDDDKDVDSLSSDA